MRVRLKIEAPVRVGGREQMINKLEYVRHGGALHVVGPGKLAKALNAKSNRALDDWNREVLKKDQNADLTDFLRKWGLLDRETVEGVSRYSVPYSHQDFNQFHPCARDAFGKLFIPGTAIKGPIRAAVLWALVGEKRANGYVREKLGDKSMRKKFFAGELDREELQNFQLPQKAKPGPHRDLLRAVKVSDAYGGKLESRIEKIAVQSYEERDGRCFSTVGASETIYVECLTPGSWAEFDVKVDDKILGDFKGRNGDLPFSNEESLLNLVRRFYSEVWDFDRRYYGVSEGSEPASAEQYEGQPEEFPELEEWIEREKGIPKGTLSKNQQRQRYRGEWRNARREFEEGDKPEESIRPSRKNLGIRDGAVKVGEIKEFYGRERPGFRLGWGSGLMSTTIDLRLDEENVGKVLKLIDSRNHRGSPKDGPKSRKLVERDGTPRYPMGWARLEEV